MHFCPVFVVGVFFLRRSGLFHTWIYKLRLWFGKKCFHRIGNLEQLLPTQYGSKYFFLNQNLNIYIQVWNSPDRRRKKNTYDETTDGWVHKRARNINSSSTPIEHTLYYGLWRPRSRFCKGFNFFRRRQGIIVFNYVLTILKCLYLTQW